MINYKLNVSKSIEEFTNFYDDALAMYRFCYEQVNKMDKLTQDYLHKLELESTTTKERNEVAKALRECRKDRRYYKDRVEELEPFIEIFNPKSRDKEGEGVWAKKILNYIKTSVGSVRKQEEYHRERVYIPRVIKDELKERKRGCIND